MKFLIASCVKLERRVERGFALIVTLSLMMLLCVIILSFLSLSSGSLRESSSSMATNNARANARLSLQLAIGQLQSLAGPDTRITAPRVPENLTDPLDSVTPAMGVWRSWEGSDHDSNGRPKAPDYNAKRQVGDPAASADAAGSGRFLGWLTSTGAGTTPDPRSVPGLFSEPASGLIPLVSSHSVKEPKRRVFVEPTLVNDSAGAIAWWTSGENTKANVAPDPKPSDSSMTDWQQYARAHAVPSPKDFGFTASLKSQAVSTDTLELMADDSVAAAGNFHDLTVWSSGLLTNAANGGWKRDLSLMTEKWDELPSTNLPFFTLKPGSNLRYSKAAPPQTTPSTHPVNPLLYWWSQYAGQPNFDTNRQIPPIVSWDYLRNACVQYRSLININPSQGQVGMPWAKESFWKDPGGAQRAYRYEFLDQPRRWPAFSRVHFTFSYASVRDPLDPGKLIPGLVLTPVVVLWNPYNVRITIASPNYYRIHYGNRISPIQFQFTVGAETPYPVRDLQTINSQQTSTIDNSMQLHGSTGASPIPITLNPGETRVFSLSHNDIRRPSGAMMLYPGYRLESGLLFTRLKTAGAEESFPPNTEFKVDLTFLQNANTGDGLGSWWSQGRDNTQHGQRASRQYITFSPTIARALWQPISAEDLGGPVTLSQVEGNSQHRKFITCVIGHRTANDTMMPGKGYLQANPLNYYNDLRSVNDLGVTGRELGAGIRHPVNSSLDIQFIHGAQNSEDLAIDISTNRGYVVGGIDGASGLTNCVSAEIPTRPIQSLVDLQHFDLRNCNPVPPFQFNIFGNSHALPLLPPNAVVRPDFPDATRLQYDDSYCLNHTFFDDWFVSSIAPDIRDWTNQNERSLESVYKDFLANSKDSTSGTPLPNSMYRPTLEAPGPDIATAYDRDVRPADSYRHIAAKLTVDGMFNVNSVSVKAWKALLGHALGQRQPYLADDGASWQAKLAPERDHVVSRMSVAGAGAVGLDAPPQGVSSIAMGFSGHRVLTDQQIEALAGEIVTQIRRRGPFLSLSEFINRRLTDSASEKDLALGGAVEAALAALAARGPTDPENPYGTLQLNSKRITEAVVNAIPEIAEAKYLFPEAALGWTAYGLPGWIRQADILRPLAPVLSVRDDTFVIRAYGDARDKNGRVTARAWCEATVQRVAGYVDSRDADTDIPVVGTDSANDQFLQAQINARFGREFRLISFRWLNPREI